MDLSQRLKLACVHCGMSESSLAKAVGVSRAYVSSVKLGKSRGDEVLTTAAHILKVDRDWLVHGDGVAPDWAISKPPLVGADAAAAKMAEVQRHIKENLPACAQGLLKWHATGKVPPGALAKAIKSLASVPDAARQVEGMVCRLSLQAAAEGSNRIKN